MTLGYETINKLILIKARQIKDDCEVPKSLEVELLKRGDISGKAMKCERLITLNLAENAISNLIAEV